jgi:hypothetical protein
MRFVKYFVSLLLVSGISTISSFAQSTQDNASEHPAMHMSDHAGMHMDHEHSAGPAITFAEMKETVAALDEARRATEKYRDVRTAAMDGYEAIGPDVPGMGIHYVRRRGGSDAFDLEHPPILLYEKNSSGGYSLVGVSYLLRAPASADGQPENPPFPKSLAKWHRHENICVLPDNSTPQGLTDEQCTVKGGHFTAETQWMVHAWIWKESPTGVFAPTNPTVQ